MGIWDRRWERILGCYVLGVRRVAATCVKPQNRVNSRSGGQLPLSGIAIAARPLLSPTNFEQTSGFGAVVQILDIRVDKVFMRCIAKSDRPCIDSCPMCCVYHYERVSRAIVPKHHSPCGKIYSQMGIASIIRAQRTVQHFVRPVSC